MQTDIKKNINNVLNSINSSCQQANINANKVSLIAVSKRKSIENIQNAMDIGIKNFGENCINQRRRSEQKAHSHNSVFTVPVPVPQPLSIRHI